MSFIASSHLHSTSLSQPGFKFCLHCRRGSFSSAPFQFSDWGPLRCTDKGRVRSETKQRFVDTGTAQSCGGTRRRVTQGWSKCGLAQCLDSRTEHVYRGDMGTTRSSWSGKPWDGKEVGHMVCRPPGAVSGLTRLFNCLW